MNLELSEEQEAVRRLARDFVEREVVPHATAWSTGASGMALIDALFFAMRCLMRTAFGSTPSCCRR